MSALDRVLALNPGSSSLKLSVLDQAGGTVAATEVPASRSTLDEAALDAFLRRVHGAGAAGVRVVHGGADLRAPVVVDDEVLGRLDDLSQLAPLHNPQAVVAIRAVRERLPVPVVACFDTAFHATIPEAAATYAVPRAWRERWGIRRYGFHGLSHAYATRRAAALLGRPLAELRMVCCHLGGGASLAAVRGGVCVDTTMGFTPVEGLMMATRSGSVDPGALIWMMRQGGVSAAEVERGLDGEGGLLALTGTADMRAVLAAEARGDRECHAAVEVYLHRLRGAVGAMAVAAGGLDVLVFTGGVGEGSQDLRRRCCAELGLLGVPAEPAAPGAGEDAVVSPPGSAVAVMVIHAREDLEIAREVRAVLAR